VHRRSLLAATATSVFVAGCTNALEEPAAGTTSRERTDEASGTPTSCAVADSAPVTRRHVPEDVTVESAGEVAVAIESKRATEELETDGWTSVTVTSSETTVEEATRGVYVHAIVTAGGSRTTSVGDGTEQRIHVDDTWDAWYHVTTARIERADGDDVRGPPADGWETIACA
jgi:hypothetical protein